MTQIPALTDLDAIFGNMDIYLFDQLLKGSIKPSMNVLDAGCGNGRNSSYLLKAGVNMFGVDSSEFSISEMQQLAQSINSGFPSGNFVVADLAALPFDTNFFDVIVCSAVLHFSRSEVHFRSMVQEMWRTLKPGGMLFCRFSTTIGMQGKLQPINNGFYQMPHGQVWFLVDKTLLLQLEKELRASRAEPLKTVLIEHDRSMTTWVLRK
ncbi:class I SAM-dependent methyltransferase [Pontibacter arcticus]|uniref:Class I SAM-dependent methyltransferase n=1 Tax=Pontibacter arcticus TaxID=2080288 RepID=A0A364RGJ0_9BACT|nr:class I SAM-dependent methyltransferase [Pontibacter arcticus]RAU83377.1 class I SAM-dependent methyltransferase [Pontibacter arcticus]